MLFDLTPEQLQDQQNAQNLAAWLLILQTERRPEVQQKFLSMYEPQIGDYVQ